MFDWVPGLGALPGDARIARAYASLSSPCSRYIEVSGAFDGFRIDLMEDSRLDVSGSPTFAGAESSSAAENDLFREEVGKEAGDREGGRSATAGIEVMGAKRFSCDI